MYNWAFDSPNHYHLRNLLCSDIYIPSDIVCGYKDLYIQMTPTPLSVDDQYQILLSPVFKNTTKQYKVTTKSTTDEQVSTFISTHGSSVNSFIEAFFKNQPPVVIRSQNGKFQMTTIFLDTNDEKNFVIGLTCILTREVTKLI